MLTALDIVTLLLVLGLGVMGGLRGFVTEVLSLFAWVAAVAVLKFFTAPATAFLTGIVGTHGGAAVLAVAILFLVTYFLGKLLAGSIGRRTRQSVLGPVDRVLGLGFGAVKGLLIATLLFLAVNLGYDAIFGGGSARPEWVAKARTYPLLRASSRAIVDWVETRRHAGQPPAAAGTPDNSAEAR